MSIWQYLVPHRDPSLLPRQWRIALGTQKSYKLDAAKKEKRRLYELKRRKLKAAASESWQAVSDKEVCFWALPIFTMFCHDASLTLSIKGTA